MNFKSPQWLNSKTPLLIIFALMIVYVIIEKWYIYANFNVKYTDEDQCILWLAADELMSGHFREPCFFGQDYNSCLEGWLAVPFIITGLNFNEAVPLVTLLMSVIPFVWLSIIYFRAKEYLLSIVFLFCMLIFSLEYHLVSVLPRGFITGVFCFGIGHVLHMKKVRHHFFWFSFFAGLGFFLNETTLFLILPVLISYWLKNLKSKQFYLQGLLGVLLPAAYKIFIYLFYHVFHPEYSYFKKNKFGWEWKNITSSIKHLDVWLFGDFSIVFIAFLALLFLFLFKKKYVYAALLFTCYVLIFLLFGLTRLQEGFESIMFSRSRLFVFIPLMIAVWFSLALPELKLSLKGQTLSALVLFLIVTVHWGLQMGILDQRIEKEILKEPKVVAFLPVKKVYEESYRYIAICKNTGNDFILYDGASKSDLILYVTIPLLSHNTVKTFLPCCDRRSWYYREVIYAEPKKIAVLRNWGEKYDRKPLQALERRTISGGDDCMVEYKLNKNIEFSIWFDFQTHLRMHAEQFNKKPE